MQTTSPAGPDAVLTLAGKYLTVVLENEAYGIAILKVREIIRPQKITSVPQLPKFIKGVINLRERVIPVMDLRAKFGLKDEFTDRTCIVVVQVKLSSALTVPMGLIVDRVEEVVDLTADEIEATAEFAARFDADYLLGMAKVKGEVKMLLDLDRVMAADTAAAMTALAAR
jgi:purine-binding chemotaxis protein CheW